MLPRTLVPACMHAILKLQKTPDRGAFIMNFCHHSSLVCGMFI